MEHNSAGLEDDSPLQIGDLQVPCLWVMNSQPYKVGPLPVINGVITPISRVITLFITCRGPPCMYRWLY